MLVERSRPQQARALLVVAMDASSQPQDAWARTNRALEERLLDAAEALLAHRGTSFVLVPIPGGLPVRCVAVGELTRIRAMVRSGNVYA